ncbi:hypothetical protein PaeCFBP13512_22205 [Paenibacillus sp. CFBP13512]|uniref:hypothetical protein n=1 Tax=Paenibacillus sp. CFBP13512 TaxID=2184007 RepID=UPI0010C12BE7|nr:hypothetical protein [Paenibacillus sp. CFBP13512]TKJ83836.1 hypothetical protein PaeCFBP13512_22205 [Paenibacillus sp. CFBP13512]
MQNDAERKIYKIIYNYFYKNNQMPDWTFLKTRTNKSKEDITKALQGLMDNGYITWQDDDVQSILMLKLDKSMPTPKSKENEVNRFYTEL